MPVEESSAGSGSAQERIGAAVHEARGRMGWTSYDLGRRAGVSHTTVLRVERGENTNIDSVMRVVRALRLSLASLIEDTPSTWTIEELIPGWGRLSAAEQHHFRALIASIAESRGQRSTLRAAEERAPYVGANADAVADARRESERLSESEDRDQEDGGEQRQRRRRSP